MITTRSTLIFFIFSVSFILSSCKDKNEEAINSDDPKVKGLSIQFEKNSPTLKHLQTAPVVSASPVVLSLPGRIVWDEDHTSHIVPPVSGAFIEKSNAGILGGNVKTNEILAYVLSPEVGTAQAEFLSAQASLVQAEKNYARVNELVEDKGASVKDLEQAKVDIERARAEATRTELHLKILGIDDTAVDQRFSVRSPIAGVVVERNTNPGMQWRPDQTAAAMFTITDPTFLWCYLDAPEYLVEQLHTGMKLTIHANAWAKENFEAVIDNIGDSIEVTSRTLKVRARLRNINRHLKNEMYVTASLSGEAQSVLEMPAKAVFLNNNEQQVFIKTAESVFVRKTIVPVFSDENRVSISQGLNKGDHVVVDGALFLEKILESASEQPTSNATNK